MVELNVMYDVCIMEGLCRADDEEKTEMKRMQLFAGAFNMSKQHKKCFFEKLKIEKRQQRPRARTKNEISI
jgi:hypothetical protein